VGRVGKARGGGKEGEMTQTLYAHMKKKKEKKISLQYTSLLCIVIREENKNKSYNF
jgi:hypothetical protein